MSKPTIDTTCRDVKTHPVERTLYDIAMECDVAVAREDGQSLTDFAEAIKDAIADKIIALNDCIEEIDELDLADEDQTQ